MPYQSLPIGNGTNLDVDQTSAKDGNAVAYLNLYQDRAGAVRTVPGKELYDDTEAGVGVKTYEHFDDQFGIRFTVCNGRVWAQYSKNGARTELTGSGLTAGVRPTFCNNGYNVFVAADSLIYRIDGSVMTALGGNSPNMVTSLIYIGGFLLANGPDIAGDAVYSDDRANEYATWEVYNNESSPDRLQALVLVDSQFIYNMGPQSVEVTYLGGNPANPFEVNRGRLSAFGCIAKYSPVYDGNSVYYLTKVGDSRKIVQNTQGQAETISFSIDPPLDQFERVDDAEGFMLSFRGQNFYCVHFPTANCNFIEQYWASVTLAFHLQTKQWLILASWNPDQSVWEDYRGTSFSFIEPWGLRLIGDSVSGQTYRLYDDQTIDYVNEATLQHRWRNDNSKTWGQYRNLGLGTEGQYERPADQYQCGIYRNRQHELVYSDNTDAGNVFRASILSGNITHGKDTSKRTTYYSYNVKRGTNEFIINSISEQFEYLK